MGDSKGEGETKREREQAIDEQSTHAPNSLTGQWRFTTGEPSSDALHRRKKLKKKSGGRAADEERLSLFLLCCKVI